MASENLKQTIREYENYIQANGVDWRVVQAYAKACAVAINGENDIHYGLQLAKRSKELTERYCLEQTGGAIWELEKYAFEYKTTNKTILELIDCFYSVLLLEAQHKVIDSFFRYIEHKREPKERFYMPRRKQLLKIGLVDALQGMIDDKYDILCISLIPGAGKAGKMSSKVLTPSGFIEMRDVIRLQHKRPPSLFSFAPLCDTISTNII